jgi:hypothetical protein
MSKALVLSVVFALCALMLGIARYDAHYADRIHHSQDSLTLAESRTNAGRTIPTPDR